MSLIWPLLEWLGGLSWARLGLPQPHWPALLLAALGAFLLTLPRATPGRLWAPLLLLPLLVPRLDRPPPGSVDLWLFDVGQGSAHLLLTAEHALLYDAGPAFPGGRDQGERVVLPALQALGVLRLDRIIISHNDLDHSGGFASVQAAFPEAEVLSGLPSAHPGSRACLAGEQWQWDGVRFEMLYPPPFLPYQGNNSSCLLKVGQGRDSVLLTGDLEAIVERRLVREQAEALASRVLVSGHHGSRTSTSALLLAAVTPEWVLHSSGWRNRWNMPHPEILQRVAASGARQASTVWGGAVRLRLQPDQPLLPEAARSGSRRYWRAQVQLPASVTAVD